jgi:hypothetical protein
VNTPVASSARGVRVLRPPVWLAVTPIDEDQAPDTAERVYGGAEFNSQIVSVRRAVADVA